MSLKKMTLAQRLLVVILVICLLNLPLIEASIFSPNVGKPKSIARKDFTRGAQPTKLQKLKAYAKGYGKAGVVMAVMLTLFKAVQVEKLFEMIFGKDTSVQDLQDEIMDKFDEIEQLITTTTHSTIDAVSQNLDVYSKLARDFQKIDDFLHFLKHQTQKMHNFIYHQPTNGTIEDFANSIVQRGNSSVLEQMTNIREMLAIDPEHRLTGYFMDTYSKYLERTATNRLCHLTTSPQQTMFDLLRKLFYGEATALELIGYAYAVKIELSQQSGGHRKFEAEKAYAKEKFEEYSATLQVLMQHYLPRMERTFWKCDAAAWQRGVTFHELNRLMYGVVDFESDISGVCTTQCSDFQKPHPNKALGYWGHAKCSGYVSECQSSTSGSFEFCLSADETSPETYTYLNSDIMKRGKKEECENKKLESASYYTTGFVKCEVCACMCHSEDAATHRYLSLLPQVSNVEENQVVVGVKFVKHNKVLYLQIMQAPMLASASIDREQAAWRELHELNMVPPDYFNFPGFHTFDNEHREIFMKELEVPEGSVVTGVKFVVKNGVPDLALRCTDVNWTTGKLNPESSFWMTETHDTYDTNDMLYQNQLPDQCKTPSFVDTASGQKFQFSTSAMEQDGGQHVLPYFDAQPVVPIPMVPLSGLGITHKADDRCGGFISPIVSTVHEDYMFGEDSEEDPF